MKKFSIKKSNVDFIVVNNVYNMKGTRQKQMVEDKFGNIAMFKYEKKDYICSESCAEKLSYEIACVLDYECARIELAEDKDGNLGVLNYLFLDGKNKAHTDALEYLGGHNIKRNEYYKISNIKNKLDELDSSLFKPFLKIMVFDALIGEQDRHEENWGITKFNGKYKISPLYDNGCSLLREFKNEHFAELFYNGIKNFDSYIRKSRTFIYKEDGIKRYKHFELIGYLNDLYHDDIQKEIKNLNKLSDDIISELVDRIPDRLLTKKHKEYIILYLKERRNILLNIK